MTALREDTPSVKHGVQKSYVSEVRKGFPDGYGEVRGGMRRGIFY